MVLDNHDETRLCRKRCRVPSLVLLSVADRGLAQSVEDRMPD